MSLWCSLLFAANLPLVQLGDDYVASTNAIFTYVGNKVRHSHKTTHRSPQNAPCELTAYMADWQVPRQRPEHRAEGHGRSFRPPHRDQAPPDTGALYAQTGGVSFSLHLGVAAARPSGAGGILITVELNMTRDGNASPCACSCTTGGPRSRTWARRWSSPTSTPWCFPWGTTNACILRSTYR